MASNVASAKVPPDGGWGWVVAGAYALNNVFVLPLISGMGLIFQDAFKDLEISATKGSLIITLNHGFGMLLSFFGGPVLSRFGYRKVALVGALFVVVGVTMITFATGFMSLIIAYSILTSIGVASVMAAFTLAINSFFKEKRGKAIGLGMSITGLGPIVMPHLMDHLLSEYGWRHAVVILGALCLHSLVAALLLRPAKWYLKDPAPPQVELIPLTIGMADQSPTFSEVELPKLKNGSAKLPTSSVEYLNENEEDYLDCPKRINLSMRSLDSGSCTESRNTISHPDLRKVNKETGAIVPASYKWWESQEINLGSSINIFNDRPSTENKSDNPVVTQKNEVKIGCVEGMLKKIIEFFDLTLLKDFIFVNILLGLSIAACAEISFSLLMPFILEDMTFSTGEIAKLMSIIAVSDFIFRMVAPFIGDWCHAKPRIMYLCSLGMIVFTRTIMLFVSSYLMMIFIAIGIGVTKGIRTVYMNIVIPSYVPIERLPFASGIQMLTNGIILIILGPILGLIKDKSGSYRLPLIILNLLTLLTVAMWLAEFLLFRCKRPRVETDEST